VNANPPFISCMPDLPGGCTRCHFLTYEEGNTGQQGMAGTIGGCLRPAWAGRAHVSSMPSSHHLQASPSGTCFLSSHTLYLSCLLPLQPPHCLPLQPRSYYFSCPHLWGMACHHLTPFFFSPLPATTSTMALESTRRKMYEHERINQFAAPSLASSSAELHFFVATLTQRVSVNGTVKTTTCLATPANALDAMTNGLQPT